MKNYNQLSINEKINAKSRLIGCLHHRLCGSVVTACIKEPLGIALWNCDTPFN